MNEEKKLIHELLVENENSAFHLAYEREMNFYLAVKTGNIDKLKSIMVPLETQHMGKLSNDRIRNLKYHLIIAIALITRFCIEGGMSPEKAYSLSDGYIQKLDGCNDIESLNALHKNCVFDFARKMLDIHNFLGMSKYIVKAKEFITNHIHEKISIELISDFLGLNKSYLCELFKKETGMTILKYIHSKKVEAASNMLKYSTYAPSDIGNYLGFSSHSHFITVFKSQTGLTPKQFRDKHYRTHFEDL